jgi:nucleoside-diphosphate kinase
VQRFEKRGFQLLALKLVQPTQAHLEEHYKDLKSKGFFAGLINYMKSGPVVAMVSLGGFSA